MKKWLWAAGIGLICAVWGLTMLAGCTQKPAASSEPEVSLDVISVPPPLDIDLSAMLTLEQVSSAVGVEMEGPQMLDDGTTAHYASGDALTTVDIHLDEVERAVYDTRLDSMKAVDEAMQAVPNLADDAWWSAETKELVLYGKGYMFSVLVDIAQAGSEDCLVAARQLAALLLEKL